jgi:hypothetical protein
MEFLEGLWWVPFLIPAAYLGFPILVYFSQKLPGDPEFEAIRLDEMDRKIAKFIMNKTQVLLDIGFAEPVLFNLPSAAPNVDIYGLMLVNRPTGDKAMVTVIIGTAVESLSTYYVEFSTRFDSGELFDTLNSKELNAFLPGKLTTRTQTPSVQDPEELFRLHTYVMEKANPTGQKWVYKEGEGLDYLAEYAFAKTFDEQVARGWLKHNKMSDTYSPTLYGAYRMAWGLMIPMSTFRRWRIRSREKAILAEFRRETAD